MFAVVRDFIATKIAALQSSTSQTSQTSLQFSKIHRWTTNVLKKFSPIVDSLSPNFLLLFIMCSALVSTIQRKHLPDTYIHTYILYLSCRSVKKEAAKELMWT